MNWSPLLYDNAVSGHHLGYMNGVVDTFARIRGEFIVASPLRPNALDNERPWIEIANHPRRSLVAGRRQLRAATSEARALGADALIDLYLDHQIWTASASKLSRAVHVLHHAEQYDRDRPRLIHTVTAGFMRQRLHRLMKEDRALVVHTRRSRELVEGLVPADRLVTAGFPVAPLDVTTKSVKEPSLLFVGAGRSEKGLDRALEALGRIPDAPVLRVVGRQPGDSRSVMMSRHPTTRAIWVDRFVSSEELRSEYASASLAVLPYLDSFGRHGGPSSVLLETLSAGVPLVTTPALADQLPPGYSGAEVAESDSSIHLSEAIERALSRLESMMQSSAREGPSYIAAHHTFDNYVRRLLSALDLVA
jgi:glycosyltransferase involved in cell wall biosynthesis